MSQKQPRETAAASTAAASTTASATASTSSAKKRKSVDEDRVGDETIKRRPARLNPFLPPVSEETEEDVSEALGDDFPYPSARDAGKASSLLGQTWKQRLASLPPGEWKGALGLGYSFQTQKNASM
ncbi:unnamed protein product, partial [Amoebophrya sp. A120]|eukprot:GSA120T00000861001.1